MNKRILIAGAVATAVTGITGIAMARTFVFVDVPESFWARDDIEWAASTNIMSGPGGQTNMFDPGSPTNRAEVAAISHRLYNNLTAQIDQLTARVTDLEREVHGPNWEWVDHSSSSSSRSSNSSSSRSSIRYSSRSSSSMNAGSMASVPSDVQAGRILFSGNMVGSAEVPPVASQGRGSIRLWQTDEGLWYEATVTGLTSPITGGHFHLGQPGFDGPIIFPVTFVNNQAQGLWAASTKETQELTNNEVYFNVHTEDNPDGEIRGQVLFNR